MHSESKCKIWSKHRFPNCRSRASLTGKIWINSQIPTNDLTRRLEGSLKRSQLRQSGLSHSRRRTSRAWRNKTEWTQTLSSRRKINKRTTNMLPIHSAAITRCLIPKKHHLHFKPHWSSKKIQLLSNRKVSPKTLVFFSISFVKTASFTFSQTHTRWRCYPVRVKSQVISRIQSFFRTTSSTINQIRVGQEARSSRARKLRAQWCTMCRRTSTIPLTIWIWAIQTRSKGSRTSRWLKTVTLALKSLTITCRTTKLPVCQWQTP